MTAAGDGTDGRSAADDLHPGVGNVLFEAWLVSRAVHALIDDALGPTGLDADEFAVYSVLARGDGMTPTALAHWMAAPPTTVSSYVKRFERRGHVRRDPSPEDGRSYVIALTDDGRAAHERAGRRFRPVLDEVDAALGPAGPETEERLLGLRRAVDALRAAD